jgi:hypothetical protein
MLDLPSLKHMNYRFCHAHPEFSAEWLTPRSRKSLQSLSLGIISDRLNPLILLWSSFPHLEELTCINFDPRFDEPLPLQHPLQRVWFPDRWSFCVYKSLALPMLMNTHWVRAASKSVRCHVVRCIEQLYMDCGAVRSLAGIRIPESIAYTDGIRRDTALAKGRSTRDR